MYSVANQNSYTVFPNQEKNVPNSDMDPTFQHLNRNIKTKLQQNIQTTVFKFFILITVIIQMNIRTIASNIKLITYNAQFFKNKVRALSIEHNCMV